MNIQWRIAPEKILDNFELNRVKEVAELFETTDCVAIDSYEMSPDGPILTSVFLITDEFIVEVRTTSNDLNCDIAPVKPAFNLRIKKMSVPINSTESNNSSEKLDDSDAQPQSQPTQNITYIEILIKHDGDLITKMGFFGEQSDAWLDFSFKKHLIKKIW